jgi:hypothetical protein
MSDSELEAKTGASPSDPIPSLVYPRSRGSSSPAQGKFFWLHTATTHKCGSLELPLVRVLRLDWLVQDCVVSVAALSSP